MLKYRLQIEGQTAEVALDPEQGLTTLDGNQRALAWRALAPGRLLLELDGKQVLAFVAPAPQGKQVFIQGRSYLVQDAERAPSRRGAGGAGGQPGQVTPPMPAVVVRILVEPGKVVEPGQGLVVVSAMKMETTLAAPYAGVVAAVNTQAEAKVMPGEILVEITPEENHD